MIARGGFSRRGGTSSTRIPDAARLDLLFPVLSRASSLRPGRKNWIARNGLSIWGGTSSTRTPGAARLDLLFPGLSRASSLRPGRKNWIARNGLSIWGGTSSTRIPGATRPDSLFPGLSRASSLRPGNKKSRLPAGSSLLVGVTGFEPAAPCTPCKCATGLRYTPKNLVPHLQRSHRYRAALGPNEGANVTELGE